MQKVSDAWKAAQRELLAPPSEVEISMNIGDPDAQAGASTSDNGQTVFSDSSIVGDETEKFPVRYATLEKNFWLLDGSFKLLPDAGPYGLNGYVGSYIADDNAEYSVYPTITVQFDKVYTSILPGLTMIWGDAYSDVDEYPTSYRVTVYNGSSVVFTETASNASNKTVFSRDISGYDKITIELLAWSHPGRRPRLKSLIVGVERTYTKADMKSFGHSMFVDPLSAELPKAEITFELFNLEGEYNPDNPHGVEKYLMERQSLDVRYGFKINGQMEWIKAGTFYLNEWKTPQNGITASFAARDALEYMSDDYTGPSTGTLSEIALAALGQAGLPLMLDGSVRWVLDSSLSSISAPADADLSDYTVAEVLQLVANAGCCVFYQDRDGRLHIEPLADGVTDYPIDQFVSYENAELELSKQLKAVNVNNGQAVVNVGPVGEVQTLKNPLVSAERAATVGQWAADYLKNRQTLNGSYRADPRLDALDRVVQKNNFAEKTVLITEVAYTYAGAFRGSYEGRAGV